MITVKNDDCKSWFVADIAVIPESIHMIQKLEDSSMSSL